MGWWLRGRRLGWWIWTRRRWSRVGGWGRGRCLWWTWSKGQVLHDEELLDLFDASATYAMLLEDQPLLPLSAAEDSCGSVQNAGVSPLGDGETVAAIEMTHLGQGQGVAAVAMTPLGRREAVAFVGAAELSKHELAALQRRFGYTKEDLNMVLKPMAATGKDAVWSMGDDAPLAFLARSPRPVYHFFRQRFAQVTNPAIDPLREAVVVSLHTRLGPWPHLLDTHAPLPGVSLPSPFLSLGQVAALRAGRYPHAESLPMAELSCLFAPDRTLTQAIGDVCEVAKTLVRGGAKLLLLTDREASSEALPIPMALALGAVHNALTFAGLRTNCGLAVEAADCRDVHHAAVLIGFGAGAVCPWLALETARGFDGDGVDGEANLLKALEGGLAKVMSKMGISVVDSYRGSHLFDILGLHESVVQRCFFGTPSQMSGIGFDELDRRLRADWEAADAPGAGLQDLPDFGWVRFRKSDTSEPHQWQPPTVKSLQTVVGSARNVPIAADATAQFAIFSREADVHPAFRLRDLLEVRPAGAELAVEAVERPETLRKRFVASAMSLGSLSPEAHQTITAAMNMMGARSNTGEGGEDPEVYREAGNRTQDSREQRRRMRESALAMGTRLRGAAAGWRWRRGLRLRLCMCR